MIKGIDISSNNSSLDIAYAKAQGVQYCYIKATEGKSYVNPCLDKQYKEAKKNGLKVGFYHFARLNGADVEAKFFLDTIKKYSADLLPVLDIEDNSIKDKTNYTIEFIKALGGKDKALIYTGLSYYHSYLNINGYKMWIAAYGQGKPSIKDNSMCGWQYSATGLNGATDMTEWYADILAPVPIDTVKIASDFLGSKQNIINCQKLLQMCGYKFGSIDGVCGSKTTSYIADFQKKNGLAVDYKFGAKSTGTALDIIKKRIK